MLGIRYRGLRSAVALAVLVVLSTPWPAVAGDKPATQTPPLRAALMDARVRPIVTPPVSSKAARRQSSPSPNPALEHPSFFKTRTGIVVLSALAVGAGYAIYSSRHDRIRSAGKQ